MGRRRKPAAPIQGTAGAPALAYGLVFGSGFCALLFQTAWVRDLCLFFGHSTAASSVVLGVFMGGLGIGAALLGGLAERTRRPIRMVALLEGGIGVWAGLSPLTHAVAHDLYLRTGGAEALGPGAAMLVRIGLAAVTLGVPAAMMGGTLPALARAAVPAADTERRTVGRLYGANTLGACAGALVTTFVLMEALGLRWTIWFGASLNIAIALAALRWSRDHEVAPGIAPQSAPAPAQSAPAPAQPAIRDLFTPGAAFASGFGFLAMELVWYRMLAPLLGGSVYTMGLVLAVVLCGIGLGGALSPGRRSRPAIALFFALQGLAICFPYLLGDRIAVWTSALGSVADKGFAHRVAEWAAITALVVFPASFVSGLIFPCLIGRTGTGNQDVALDTGRITFWNTAGAICGSFLVGLVALPLLSAPGVWRAVTGLMLSVAVVGAAGSGEGRLLPALACFALAAICAGSLAVATGPTAAWRHSPIGAGRLSMAGLTRNRVREKLHAARRAVVAEADGRESAVALTSTSGFSLLINGKSDGNAISDAETTVMLGLIPATLHPKPERALVIGLGLGSTAGWLAAVEPVRQVDVVELEPEVVSAARRCHAATRNVLENPKVSLVIGDAREWVLTTKRSYDLIVSEPSNPYRAGVASLYSREFYQASARVLRPGGIFAQWVQGYEVSRPTLATICATLRTVFPHVQVWCASGGDLVFLASATPAWPGDTAVRAALAREPMKSALARIAHAEGLEGFVSFHAADDAFTRMLAAGSGAAVPINTDDHLVIEFGFAASVGQGGDGGAALVAQARDRGMDRAPASPGLDPELVAEHDALHGDKRYPPSGAITARRRAQREAWMTYMQGDLARAQELWGSQPARTLRGRIMLAECLVHRGDAAAGTMARALEASNPAEADGIRWLLAVAQGHPGPALTSLQAFSRRLRDEPWAFQLLAARVLKTAGEEARRRPELRDAIHAALSQPFAANYLEDYRRGCVTHMFVDTGDPRVANALEVFEPHVPWNRGFLTMRAREYGRTGHRLEKQAVDDLAEFLYDAEPSEKPGASLVR